MSTSSRSVLPGFRLSLGVTLTWMGLFVVLPLAALGLRATGISTERFVAAVSSSRALSAFALSFGASLAAALVNTVFGVLLAWALVRYDFPLKRLVDALVDLPFALPTAVGGLALTAVYGPRGWLGEPLARLGIESAFSRLGVVIALTFVGLPFVVRTVGPVLEAFDREQEEAAATLGASRWLVLRRVVLPTIAPATLTGFALAFARGLGEYGSVVFISGNIPRRTEVVPYLVMAKLEQFDEAGAMAIAVVMLVASVGVLAVVGRTEAWASARALGGGSS